VRYPTSQDGAARSQNGLVAQQLNNSAAGLRSRLYNLLTNYHDYAQFSNEAWLPRPNPNAFDSVESIHDAIHGLVGNGGHMSIVSYAAFDPVFMLHHTMVDRIFAMWQKLNPNSRSLPTDTRLALIRF
jgi:tyrosinase